MMTVTEFCNKYYVDRKGTNSVKWDGMEAKFGSNDLLPLWVADMDFRVPDSVLEKMHERVDHGVFGYTFASDSYFEAYENWQKTRHNVTVNQDWIRFNSGVVNSFNYLIQMLTTTSDHVMIFAPVYPPFFDAALKNGRPISVVELEQVDNTYELDFTKFEEQIVRDNVKVFLHCSPQNPVGKIWTKEELEQMFDILVKHQVKIIVDEIHQDFIRKGEKFTSALALSDKYHPFLYVLNSTSKTFNIAALVHSHLVIPNAANRAEYDEFAETVAHYPLSVFGLVAAEACYRDAGDWLDSLLDVIEYNYELLKEKLTAALPLAKVVDKSATYLAWVDFSPYLNGRSLEEVMEKDAKIAVNHGDWFGQSGAGFVRINLATKPENIAEAAERIISALS